ncbi:unnamed protein product [Closterium sp. NIES-54]
MHSHLFVSGLPKSLPPLSWLLLPPCLSCVEGRQCAAPHSSFPHTTALLQTLHMDVWGPALVRRQDHERYFMLIVDDYTCYTTVFPLQRKVDVCSILIPWIRTVHRQLSARFQQVLQVLRLHSDRGDEFSSRLLEDFCSAEGIAQSFTLLAFPQHNGISELHIGLVMEVARTSMIHAAAPHFLWSFAVQDTTHQLNLWPVVWGSLSLVRDTTAAKLSSRTTRCVFLGIPTDAPGWQIYHPASRRVLSSQDVTFDELVGFYRLHPHASSLVPPLPLFLVRGPPPRSPLIRLAQLKGGDAAADNTAATRRSPSLDTPHGFPPRLSSPPLQPVAVDSSAAGGGDTGGADSRGAGSRGADRTSGGGVMGATAGGFGDGQQQQSRRQEPLSPQQLCMWAVRWGSPGGGAWGAGDAGTGGAGGAGAGGAGAGGAGGAGAEGAGGAGAGGAGTGGAGAGGTGAGGACAGGAGAGGAGAGGAGAGGAGARGASAGGGGLGGAGAGGPGARRQETPSPRQLCECAVWWGSPSGEAGSTGTEGAGTAAARGAGAGGPAGPVTSGSGGATTQQQPSALRHLLSLPPAVTEFPVAGTTPPLLFPLADQSQPLLLPDSPLPAPAPYTEVTESLTESREPAARPVTPIRTHRAPRARPPPVPCTHTMALRPSSAPQRVVLPSPPASSLTDVSDPESDLARAARPTVSRLLATLVTDLSFAST